MTEQLILERIHDGDKTAMKALYDKFVGSLTAVCSRYLADSDDVKDVLQEVFIKVFTQIKSFRFRGEGSLKAWVTRIAINMSINYLKAEGRIGMVHDDLVSARLAAEEEDEPDADGVPPDELHKMIMSLPDGYRTVLNLYVFENKSHKEIATILNIKATSSASQLYHAKAMMARKIKEYKRTH